MPKGDNIPTIPQQIARIKQSYGQTIYDLRAYRKMRMACIFRRQSTEALDHNIAQCLIFIEDYKVHLKELEHGINPLEPVSDATDTKADG